MNQKERILHFLQGLLESETNPEEQAVILRAQNFVKKDITNEDCPNVACTNALCSNSACTNESSITCGFGTKNDKCTNRNGVCGGSSNSQTCYNEPINPNMSGSMCLGGEGNPNLKCLSTSNIQAND